MLENTFLLDAWNKLWYSFKILLKTTPKPWNNLFDIEYESYLRI